MWNDILQWLKAFPSAVLTGVDAEGYPVSIRCYPVPDHAARVLRVAVPEGIGIQAGPAGLLCHSHDEWLRNLHSFLVRGILESDDDGWIFRPTRFVPGQGFDESVMGMVRYARAGRRRTLSYLKKRGIKRIKVPWSRVFAHVREINQDQ